MTQSILRHVRPARPGLWAFGVWGFAGALCLGVACSDESTEAPECAAGSGPVSGAAEMHCQSAQEIGACMTGAIAGADEEPEEEEFSVYFGNEADDDDCKYHVSFENTCAALDQPVTFTLSLNRKAGGDAATGADPEGLEVYLADDPTHISPSNDIEADETSPGRYRIGPVVFDRSGRWVVRFHYFETCSDLPEDSPHGHVAFYFDVP